MAELTLPDEYTPLLDGRVVLITGVGRSGTTIVGKIVGSLETRAASVWRCLTEIGLAFVRENPGSCLQFRYEDVVVNPEELVRACERRFRRCRTALTETHMAAARSHSVRRLVAVPTEVEAPERGRFARVMEELAYAA